jgi:hypothetical protein
MHAYQFALVDHRRNDEFRAAEHLAVEVVPAQFAARGC